MQNFESNIDHLLREIETLNTRIWDLQRENIKLREGEGPQGELDKYRLLFENESDAVVVFDAESLSVEEVNKAALQLFRYNREEFLQLKVLDISNERDKAESAIRRVFSGEVDSYKVPLRYFRTKDERVFPAEVFAGGFITDGKKKVIVTVRDITERIVSEDRIKQRLFLEETLARISGVLLSSEPYNFDKVIGVLGEAVGANRAYILLFRDNYSRMDCVNEWRDAFTESHKSVMQGMDTSRWRWSISKIMSGETLLINNVADLPPEAEKDSENFLEAGARAVAAVALKSLSGEVIGLAGFESTKGERIWAREDVRILRVVANMVSTSMGRKYMEEAVKESEERYRALFSSAAEGILVAEIGTKKFLYANQSICQLLGYSEEDLKNMAVDDIHPKEDLPHVISEFEAQARGEKVLAKDIPCRKKDGSTVYVDIKTTSMSIDGRECNVGFFTDITDRKKKDEEVQGSQAELNKINKELHAKISELETALNHIKRLEGLIPICMNCKKMKVEGGDPVDPHNWVSMEQYISTKTNASLTHGLCPECMKKLYGDQVRRDKKT